MVVLWFKRGRIANKPTEQLAWPFPHSLQPHSRYRGSLRDTLCSACSGTPCSMGQVFLHKYTTYFEFDKICRLTPVLFLTHPNKDTIFKPFEFELFRRISDDVHHT